MLRALFDRPELGEVTRIETTITRDNKPSWGLFRAFARKRGGTLTHAPHFERGAHFDGAHATEYLVEIDFSEATRAAVEDSARAASDAAQGRDSARQQAA